MTRRWLIDLPTRIHLWSAEFQIRHRSPLSDPARLRNLDVLRAYRRSRAGGWDDPRFFFPIGVGALLIGLLTLTWAVRALRWRVRV